MFGPYTVTPIGDNDVFLAKYDSSGNEVFVKTMGGSTSDIGNGITIDDSDNAYIVGSFSNSATFGSTVLTADGAWDMFICKYDSIGNVVYANKAGGFGWDYGNAIAIDGSGNLFVTGSFANTATFGSHNITELGNFDVYMAKFGDPFIQTPYVPIKLKLRKL